MATTSSFDDALVQLSNKLIPSDEFLKTGKETADKIFEAIRTVKLYSVDRCKIVGSIGKATAILVDPDIDLVVFVNDQNPPFQGVLTDFEDVLKRSNLGIENVKVTDYSVQFTANDIDFDVLPARNFVAAEGSQPGTEKTAQIQADAVMKHISEHPGDSYMYGSAVCEKNLEFLKKQTPFVHDVIRLAKFWNKTLHLGTYVSGRSSMIELVAIKAGIFQEESGLRSIPKAFHTFITLMSNYDNLEVIFHENYTEGQIPSDVRAQRPLVLDPVNPYNNFAHYKEERDDIVVKFKKFATETLARLDKADLDFTGFFEVQPKVIVCGPQPSKWIVAIKNMELVNPKFQIYRKTETSNLGVKQVQNCLLTSLATLTLGVGTKVDDENIKKCVQNVVDVNILGQAPTVWESPVGNIEDYDFNLFVPIPGEKDRCVVLGGTW